MESNRIILFFIFLMLFGKQFSQQLTGNDSVLWFHEISKIKAISNDQSKTKEYSALLKKTLLYAQNKKIKWGEALMCVLIGMDYVNYVNPHLNGRRDSALIYFLAAENIINNSTTSSSYQEIKYLLMIYANIGAFYINSDREKAINYNLKSAELCEKVNNQLQSALNYSNISFIYLTIGDYETGLKYAEKLKKYLYSPNFMKNIGLQPKLVLFYSTISFFYVKNNQRDSSQKFLRLAENRLQYCNENLIPIQGPYNFLLALAKTENNLISTNFKEALLNSNNVLKNSSEKEDSTYAIYLIAKAQKGLKNNALALFNFQYALSLAKQTNNVLNQIMILNELMDYDYSSGSFKSKNSYFNDWQILKEAENLNTSKNFYEEKINAFEINKREKKIADLNKDNKIKALEIENEQKTKRQLLFLITATLIVIAILLIAIRQQIKSKKINIAKTELLNKQALEIARYQSQMNPHFVFNAMAGIQALVMNNENKEALEQLLKFTKLMRITLNNMETEHITLKEEEVFLQQYFNFEKRRFNNKVDFNFEVSSEIIPNETYIMPMLIQPFVENAIKHAQLDQIENGKISINISLKNGNLLEIFVIDNGVGLKQEHTVEHLSKGIKITKKRIMLFMKKYNFSHNFEFSISNLSFGGVEVRFLIPFISYIE